MKYKIHQKNCIVTGLYKLTNEIPRIHSIMHAKHSGRLTAMHSGRLTAEHSGRRNGSKILLSEPNRSFSSDVTAAILVYQNNEMAAILVYGTGISSFLFKYFVLFHHPTGATDHVSENDLYELELLTCSLASGSLAASAIIPPKNFLYRLSIYIIGHFCNHQEMTLINIFKD